MDLNKFTQKSIEAVQESQNIAMGLGNPELSEIHLHAALLRSNEGLIPRVLSLMGINSLEIRKAVDRKLEKLPKQTGGNIYPGRSYSKLLVDAEEEAKKFKDEYVGVEHIYLALLSTKG